MKRVLDPNMVLALCTAAPLVAFLVWGWGIGLIAGVSWLAGAFGAFHFARLKK